VIGGKRRREFTFSHSESGSDRLIIMRLGNNETLQEDNLFCEMEMKTKTTTSTMAAAKTSKPLRYVV
jgi:hypothetical protein